MLGLGHVQSNEMPRSALPWVLSVRREGSAQLQPPHAGGKLLAKPARQGRTCSLTNCERFAPCKRGSAIQVRRKASRCSDRAVVRRLLAIALVLEGRLRTEAAEAFGVDRPTLREWVHHDN
jgi:hypothetical protein